MPRIGEAPYLATTAAPGRYRAVVPFGDITITASSGSLTRTTLIGTRTLASAKVHVTVQQAMRPPGDANGDGVSDWLMTLDLQGTPHDWHGVAIYDMDRNGAFGPGEVRATGATITASNKEFPFKGT